MNPPKNRLSHHSFLAGSIKLKRAGASGVLGFKRNPSVFPSAAFAGAGVRLKREGASGAVGFKLKTPEFAEAGVRLKREGRLSVDELHCGYERKPLVGCKRETAEFGKSGVKFKPTGRLDLVGFKRKTLGELPSPAFAKAGVMFKPAGALASVGLRCERQLERPDAVWAGSKLKSMALSVRGGEDVCVGALTTSGLSIPRLDPRDCTRPLSCRSLYASNTSAGESRL